MKPRSIVLTLAVIAAAGLCVRLGFWQVSRWHEKRALNQRMQQDFAAPAWSLRPPLPSADSLRGRRVELRGHYDETRQILLTARPHQGEPGVSVVTPLMLNGSDTAVLVERGWLPAIDGLSADPFAYREPGAQAVRGVVAPIERAAKGYPMRVVTQDSLTLLTMRALHWDSLSRRMPYAIAPFLVHELPGPGVPGQPLRLSPEPADEQTHVSYAVQWFMFAAIILGGSAALAWSRRRSSRKPLPR